MATASNDSQVCRKRSKDDEKELEFITRRPLTNCDGFARHVLMVDAKADAAGASSPHSRLLALRSSIILIILYKPHHWYALSHISSPIHPII